MLSLYPRTRLRVRLPPGQGRPPANRPAGGGHPRDQGEDTRAPEPPEREATGRPDGVDEFHRKLIPTLIKSSVSKKIPTPLDEYDDS